jgi:hypothetical protein
MLRVIYTPDMDAIHEADSMASEYGLPVVVGVSPAIEDLDFDRSKTQLLMIPSEQWFSVSSHIIKIGAPVTATYVDELTPVDGVWLDVSRSDGSRFRKHLPDANFSKKDVATFRIVFESSGSFRLSVVDKQGTIAYEDVTVTI